MLEREKGFELWGPGKLGFYAGFPTIWGIVLVKQRKADDDALFSFFSSPLSPPINAIHFFIKFWVIIIISLCLKRASQHVRHLVSISQFSCINPPSASRNSFATSDRATKCCPSVCIRGRRAPKSWRCTTGEKMDEDEVLTRAIPGSAPAWMIGSVSFDKFHSSRGRNNRRCVVVAALAKTLQGRYLCFRLFGILAWILILSSNTS